MVSNTTIINTGSPYDICDIMNIHSINDIIEISISNDYICHYKVIIIFENNIIIASDVQTDNLSRWHMELVINTSLEILI